MAKPPPAFTTGQWVQVIISDRNRTLHTGKIRAVIWHHKDKRYNYYLEERGKKVPKRYFEEDLEIIRSPGSGDPIRHDVP
jgi:hypothetical protein